MVQAARLACSYVDGVTKTEFMADRRTQQAVILSRIILGETATKLKLMQFKTAPGARVDNTFIHSSYGFRYLTIPVKNLNMAVESASKAGAKPIAKCPVPLPEGFPAGLALANYRDPDGNLVELVGPWTK